ncbi:regulator of G-protein signaling 8-like [Carettochelys insculpta]|uniref:regulator of G-protein signaling 8-like n=1 Tax=Carettochelys insculpta TaxID=44489 RepID=UPI003EB73EE3
MSSVSQLEIPQSLEERLTLEEASSWKCSFDCVLASLTGQTVFMEFLRTEHSDENMAFWLACEDLRGSRARSRSARKPRRSTWITSPSCPQRRSALMILCGRQSTSQQHTHVQ